MRKGQITVLILVGLFALLIIGLALYAFSKSQESSSERAKTIEAEALSLIRKGEEYASQCLSIAGENGLQMAGKQGGYVYKSQGSIAEQGIRGKNYIEDNTRVIPFRRPIPQVQFLQYRPAEKKESDLIKGNLRLGLYVDPREYPFAFFPEVRDYRAEDKYLFESYFECNCHKLIIPFLTREEGVYSIQEMVESYIETSTIECLHEAKLPEGMNLTIKGYPSANVKFGEAYTVITMNATVLLTIEKANYTKILTQFVTTAPVRFKRMYEFMRNITAEDSTNMTYNVSKAERDSMFAEVQQRMDNGYNDLLSIMDKRSRINDRYFEFVWARENREPGLHHINQSYIYNFIYCNGTTIAIRDKTLYIGNGCNMYEREQVLDPVSIRLNATDPDDDEVEFQLYVNNRKTNNYTITRQDVIDSNRANMSFKVEVRASDGELFDWQTLNMSVAFPVHSTYLTGSVQAYSGSAKKGSANSMHPHKINIPGLPIKVRLVEVYSDDGNTITIGSDTIFTNAPCGLYGWERWTHCGAKMCDRFLYGSNTGGTNPIFRTNITKLLYEGDNTVVITIHKCPNTGKADGWLTINYTYLSPFPTEPSMADTEIPEAFENIYGCVNLTEAAVYTLQNDITSGQSCINIDGEGIILNCNNHLVQGISGTGIKVEDSSSGTEIRNCNVMGFDTGIDIGINDLTSVINSKLTGNKVGIRSYTDSGKYENIISCQNDEKDIEMLKNGNLLTGISCDKCDDEIKTTNCAISALT